MFVSSDRGLGGVAGLFGVVAEEELAVVAAEEEGEAVQVGAEGVRAVGVVADVGQERRGERGGVGGQPAGDELEEEAGGLGLERDVADLVDLCGCPHRSMSSATWNSTAAAPSSSSRS